MNPGKIIELQQQMKINQSEMKDSFKDLDSWLSDIKTKDEKLKKPADISSDNSPQNLPPVRNSLHKKKKKKIVKNTSTDTSVTRDGVHDLPSKRISGYDFQSWDKFDVDKACEEVDNQSAESSSEYETDDEWEELRMKQQATMCKDQGNQLFKEGRLNEAIECYTRGIQCDPYNGLLSANRAMALLKQEKFGAAELDCSAAIALDPTYVKAYQRRGTARIALKKYEEAKTDFHRVLTLDAKNNLAKLELERLDKLMNPPKFSVSSDGELGIIKAVYKPSHMRSKKPLHRLVIEEVGDEIKTITQIPIQGKTKQKLVDKDNKQFDSMIQKSSATNHSDEDILNPKSSPADIGKIPKDKQENTADLKINLKGINDGEESSLKPKSPMSSPRVPQAPTSSYQFQADWKVLKNNDEHFYEYFRQIDPKSYAKLFGQFLDAEILTRIFHVLKTCYVRDKSDIIPVLHQIARVKRFDMTIMFLSSQDKKIVEELLEYVEKMCDAAALKELKHLYQL